MGLEYMCYEQPYRSIMTAYKTTNVNPLDQHHNGEHKTHGWHQLLPVTLISGPYYLGIRTFGTVFFPLGLQRPMHMPHGKLS